MGPHHTRSPQGFWPILSTNGYNSPTAQSFTVHVLTGLKWSKNGRVDMAASPGAIPPVAPHSGAAGALTRPTASGVERWGPAAGRAEPGFRLCSWQGLPVPQPGLALNPGATCQRVYLPQPFPPAPPPPLTRTSRLHIISACIFIAFPPQDMYLNLLLVNITTGDANLC